MIKLFSLKQQKKDEEGTPRAGGSQKKASAAQLRITKGTCKTDVRHFSFQNTHHRVGKSLNNCKIFDVAIGANNFFYIALFGSTFLSLCCLCIFFCFRFE